MKELEGDSRAKMGTPLGDKQCSEVWTCFPNTFCPIIVVGEIYFSSRKDA